MSEINYNSSSVDKSDWESLDNGVPENKLKNKLKDDMAFEDHIKNLEKITQKMSAPNLNLEEGLKLFDEGSKISKACQEILDEAEQKIEYILNKNNH